VREFLQYLLETTPAVQCRKTRLWALCKKEIPHTIKITVFGTKDLSEGGDSVVPNDVRSIINHPFAALSRQTQTFCFADDGKAKGATLPREKDLRFAPTRNSI
jgi:hypothetical protein